MKALLTDLYELNMVASYLRRGMTGLATFSLFVRQLPPQRGFLVAAGIENCLDFLQDLRFTEEEIRFLGEEWKEVAIRAEANWQNGEEWDVGYDEAILDQIELDLRNKLGRTEKSRASRGSELQRQ